ncbi:MAG: energy-coupling factor transporter transmembrane protein EcfT [Methylophilaceae bacterium]|nr:energy-coupling factor transporter transmembrane protein EcfT [Methylophilaceae bacterium]
MSILLAFGVALHSMQTGTLLVSGVLLAGMLIRKGGRRFLRLIKKARWLLLSMLLVYAYATPGEYVMLLPESMAPTHEGLHAGLQQAGRLVLMVAALSVLLATTPRQELIAGMYWLSWPLRFFGLAPERFAVRLWLTLHYVETMPKGALREVWAQGWRLEALQMLEDGPSLVSLAWPRWRWYDIGVLMVIPWVFWVLT